MPEGTLLGYANHGKKGSLLTGSNDEANLILQQFEDEGFNYHE